MTTGTLKAMPTEMVIEAEDAVEHPIAVIAEKLRDIGMYLFLFLPLVFSPEMTENLFEIPKSTALALLTILTVASGLIYILLRGRLRLRRTALDVPLLVLLAISLLSTVFSVSPLVSLYGEHNRRDGLLTLANYALIYVMAVNFFAPWRRLRQAAEIIALVTAFVSLAGVLEFFGLSMHLGLVRVAFQGRVFATMGNPDFLGAYLALISPLPIGLMMISRSRTAKLFWSAVYLLVGACLALTLTRGAWIGFAASILVLVLFARSLRPHARWLVGLMLVLVVVGIAAEAPRLMSRGVPAVPSSPGAGAPDVTVPPPSFVDRLASLTNLQNGTAQVRFETWRQSLGIIRDYPILGTGLNSFQVMATRYYSPAYAAGEGADHMPDRPHNQYLQWAAFAGVPGLLAYLAVLGALIWSVLTWLRRAPNDPRRLLLIALFAGWVGYVVQNFFLFDSIETAPQFWLVTALVIAITRPRAMRLTLWSPRRVLVLAWPATVAFVVVSVYLSFLAIRPQIADAFFLRGQIALKRSQSSSAVKAEAYDDMASAVSWAPDDLYYREMYALSLLDRIGNPDVPQAEQSRDLATAMRMINSAINDNPRHANLHFSRGAIRQAAGETHLSEAYQDFLEAVALQPFHRPANAAVSRVGRQLGRLTDAIAAERRILIVDPQNVPTLIDLSQDYLSLGRMDDAEGLIKRLVSLVPNDPSAAFLQGVLNEGKHDSLGAVGAYSRALELDPSFQPAKDGLERLSGSHP